MSRALALVHVALEDMSEFNVSAAKAQAANVLPAIRRLIRRGQVSSELLVEVASLNAMLSLLTRRVGGDSVDPIN